ncbi:hypothetical protein C8R43DRAFT_1132431 [Mycena crocata]|nr:hypothetical protein C8R43DRAFT_1132419 [Mycena crocata]KAJ7136524.1 hypothetical protein C8R43DRAFT_1132426 [Mycena crocata]KAJ7136529.1 hypothetical protein C8R43DRAFT_1132431 [Mycena crocata]
MENYPYITQPLPQLSTRVVWRHFASRPLPSITARMSRDELALIMGENPKAPTLPAPAGASTGTNGNSGSSLERGEENQRPDDQQPEGERREFKELAKKPKGPPNHPESGGYNIAVYLQTKHGWKEEEVKAVKEKVQALAKDKLDINLCYTKQKTYGIERVCKEAEVKKEYPIARGFDNCWPIRDMLKVHLKNTSEAWRRRCRLMSGQQRRDSPEIVHID